MASIFLEHIKKMYPVNTEDDCVLNLEMGISILDSRFPSGYGGISKPCTVSI